MQQLNPPPFPSPPASPPTPGAQARYEQRIAEYRREIAEKIAEEVPPIRPSREQIRAAAASVAAQNSERFKTQKQRIRELLIEQEGLRLANSNWSSLVGAEANIRSNKNKIVELESEIEELLKTLPVPLRNIEQDRANAIPEALARQQQIRERGLFERERARAARAAPSPARGAPSPARAAPSPVRAAPARAAPARAAPARASPVRAAPSPAQPLLPQSMFDAFVRSSSDSEPDTEPESEPDTEPDTDLEAGMEPDTELDEPDTEPETEVFVPSLPAKTLQQIQEERVREEVRRHQETVARELRESAERTARMYSRPAVKPAVAPQTDPFFMQKFATPGFSFQDSSRRELSEEEKVKTALQEMEKFYRQKSKK
jgi:hypothetical protein